MTQGTDNSVRTADDNSFFSVLREAFRGSSRDFTKGPILIAIILLAVPMILEMMMEGIFALVDIYFVAHLGASSVAVVVLTESILALVYAVAIGLSIGATATVARRIGEKDEEGAARSAAHALFLGLAVSAVISVLGIVFAPQMLRALGAEPEVAALGTTFMRIMLGGNAVILFLFLLNAIFRGAGDAAIAMRVLILSNGLNIVLAPCFVYGPDIFAFLHIAAPDWLVANWPFPHLGVTGAAVGTTIGRGAGVLFAASQLFRSGGRITIRKHDWRPDFGILKGMLKIAAPAMLQFTIGTASWSALVRVVAVFGNDALAGYGVGLRIIIFALLPAIGLGNAAATLVGQNLGAGNPDRAERSVWTAAIINGAFLGIVGALFLLFGGPMVGLFTDEPNVAVYGRDTLRIVAYGFVFYGFGLVLENAFNGAGDTWTPTFLNFFVFWLFEIPLAYVLANHFELGPHGVFWAITLSFSMLAVVSGVMFKRGKWKAKVV